MTTTDQITAAFELAKRKGPLWLRAQAVAMRTEAWRAKAAGESGEMAEALAALCDQEADEQTANGVML